MFSVSHKYKKGRVLSIFTQPAFPTLGNTDINTDIGTCPVIGGQS